MPGLLHATSRCLLWGVMLVASTTLPGPVRADGCFVWRNEKLDIREPEQKALIYFHDGIEDLVLFDATTAVLEVLTAFPRQALVVGV